MKSLSYYHLLNKERTIINIIDDIERPYWDKFNKITREYFKGKDIRISKLNGNKKGYIQIRSAEWDNRIHYEWYPISFNELFFKDSPLKLCIHVEVNSLKKQFKRYFHDSLKDGKVEIKITRDQKDFKTWLKDAYEEISKDNTWDKLQKISDSIKNQQQNASAVVNPVNDINNDNT